MNNGMEPSAVGFLFRQLAERGIRVRGGHLKMDDIPEEANLILWDSVRCWYDDEGRCREELTGEKVPVAWWVFEHKIGEEPDTVMKTIKGVRQLVDIIVEIYGPEWREHVGTLLDVVEAPANQWVFETGVVGELRNNNPGGFMQGILRCEWLECDVCGESTCAYKKYGPVTANRKCSMTPHCEGHIRRLPLRFAITSPRTIPKRKPKELEVESSEVSADTIGESDTL